MFVKPNLPGRLVHMLAYWGSHGCRTTSITARHEVHSWRSFQLAPLRLVTVAFMTLHHSKPLDEVSSGRTITCLHIQVSYTL